MSRPAPARDGRVVAGRVLLDLSLPPAIYVGWTCRAFDFLRGTWFVPDEAFAPAPTSGRPLAVSGKVRNSGER